MYAARVDEQLIMETTGHKSECVRQYKKTSDELLCAAQETISKLPPGAKESSGFGEDIIEVSDSKWFDQNVLPQADETVSYIVNEERKWLRAHKVPCLSTKTTGSCSKMCDVLRTVDKKTVETKKKKSHLSLKFVKTNKK